MTHIHPVFKTHGNDRNHKLLINCELIKQKMSEMKTIRAPIDDFFFCHLQSTSGNGNANTRKIAMQTFDRVQLIQCGISQF